MNVEQRILLERITTLNELSDAERTIAAQDERLLALIADNALLAEMGAAHTPAPDRRQLLAGLDGRQHKEHLQMNIISGLLSGRSLRAQAAIICLLALGLFVVSQLLPGKSLMPGAQPAWASSDGYTLVYELPGLTSFSTSDSGLSTAIDNWRAGMPDYEGKVAIRVSTDPRGSRVALSVSSANEEQVDSLVALISESTGFSDPQVTGTTVFETADSAGPADIMFGSPARFSVSTEPSLGRIAGLFAGGEQPDISGAVVHGGGGQIILGRYSGAAQLPADTDDEVTGGQLAAIASGDCSAEGLVSLYGDKLANVYASGSFSGSDIGGNYVNGIATGGGSWNVDDNEGKVLSWSKAVGIGTGSGGGYGVSSGSAGGESVAWVGANDSGNAYAFHSGNGDVAWSSTAAPQVEGSEALFGVSTRPSGFVVLDDCTDAAAPNSPAAHAYSSYWVPAQDGGGCSYKVLERSKGNHELLPGYTIFGDTSGMRVFSFPKGANAQDIQKQLDEWYEKNGRRISLKVGVQGKLSEELVLIVAEGVDSSQSLIILSGDADVPQPAADDDADNSSRTPAPAPKQP